MSFLHGGSLEITLTVPLRTNKYLKYYFDVLLSKKELDYVFLVWLCTSAAVRENKAG